MEKYIYKIRHKPTGKFVRIKLKKDGVSVWAELGVINGRAGYGKVLYDTHKGWSTPPEPSAEEFDLIDCEVVRYKVTSTIIDD